jgi:hypothetical protein
MSTREEMVNNENHELPERQTAVRGARHREIEGVLRTESKIGKTHESGAMHFEETHNSSPRATGGGCFHFWECAREEWKG